MSQDSVEALREELERTRAELRSAREQIAAMEMSFFWKLRNLWWKLREGLNRLRSSRPFAMSAEGLPAARDWLVARPRSWGPRPLTEPVDVVVLCPDGDAGARACLDSAIRRSRPPARVIAARDRDELARHAADSPAAWVALVDAPVELPEDWLERLVTAVESDPQADAAVPLSRATPSMETAWDRARIALPQFEDFTARVAAESGRLRPSAGSVPPGVLLVQRRALAAVPPPTRLPELAKSLEEYGGRVLLADDVAVEQKGGGGDGSAPECRVLSGVASRLGVFADVEAVRAAGRRFEGKRVLFVLPVVDRGGGANIVLSEGRAMAEMGVDARVVNLRDFEYDFRRNYPDPEIPFTFAPPGEIPELARDYDAVVATANTSVEWL
ncbi:MAG TPA: hypothetical protein VII01_15770, partial [Solirubrobacteraceae bacterium]